MWICNTFKQFKVLFRVERRSIRMLFKIWHYYHSDMTGHCEILTCTNYVSNIKISQQFMNWSFFHKKRQNTQLLSVLTVPGWIARWAHSAPWRAVQYLDCHTGFTIQFIHSIEGMPTLGSVDPPCQPRAPRPRRALMCCCSNR